jgi:glycosyltransferase involved in cell wall biosynthesis
MTARRSKPRIALLGLGVIGGEPMGQGIPVIKDLFERLSEHFDITFYSFKPVDKTQIPSAIQVRQTIAWSFLPERIKFIFIPILFTWDQLFRRSQLIFAVSIYPTGKWAVVLGKVFNAPVITQLIAFEAIGETNLVMGDLTKPWLRKLTESVCKKTTALVAVAYYQKDLVLKSLPAQREIDVLPLRINPEKFPYNERTITSSTIQFIHIGYYGIVKDQDTMFKAFAKVATTCDCHLTVIGKGYDDEKLHALLQNLEVVDKISFVGLVKQSELPEYYKKSHILLHTARFETGCAVIQEAMASGVVVCGTEVGILSDIGDQYAIIAGVGDADALADKVIQLVNNPGQYKKLRDSAYKWITTYGAAWSAEQYRIFLDKLLLKS